MRKVSILVTKKYLLFGSRSQPEKSLNWPELANIKLFKNTWYPKSTCTYIILSNITGPIIYRIFIIKSREISKKLLASGGILLKI